MSRRTSRRRNGRKNRRRNAVRQVGTQTRRRALAHPQEPQRAQPQQAQPQPPQPLPLPLPPQPLPQQQEGVVDQHSWINRLISLEGKVHYSSVVGSLLSIFGAAMLVGQLAVELPNAVPELDVFQKKSWNTAVWPIASVSLFKFFQWGLNKFNELTPFVSILQTAWRVVAVTFFLLSATSIGIDYDFETAARFTGGLIIGLDDFGMNYVVTRILHLPTSTTPAITSTACLTAVLCLVAGIGIGSFFIPLFIVSSVLNFISLWHRPRP
ncbi:unnamed protein product [Caenorhabditis brenneri]